MRSVTLTDMTRNYLIEDQIKHFNSLNEIDKKNYIKYFLNNNFFGSSLFKLSPREMHLKFWNKNKIKFKFLIMGNSPILEFIITKNKEQFLVSDKNKKVLIKWAELICAYVKLNSDFYSNKNLFKIFKLPNLKDKSNRYLFISNSHNLNVQVENWKNSKSELNKYLFNKNSTFDSIGKEEGRTRERIRQRINQQASRDISLMNYYAKNYKIHENTAKKWKRLLVKNGRDIFLKIEYSEITKIKNNEIDNIKKKEELFEKCFIGYRTHLEEFKITDEEIKIYKNEINKANLKLKIKSLNKRNIHTLIARKPNVIHVNKDNFIFQDLSMVEKMINEISNWLTELKFNNGIIFCSVNDKTKLDKWGFSTAAGLHSFIKKNYKDKNFFPSHQPRIDFIKRDALEKIIEKQLELWNIKSGTEISTIAIKIVKYCNYSRLQAWNLINILDKKGIKYTIFNKKIERKRL